MVFDEVFLLEDSIRILFVFVCLWTGNTQCTCGKNKKGGWKPIEISSAPIKVMTEEGVIKVKMKYERLRMKTMITESKLRLLAGWLR